MKIEKWLCDKCGNEILPIASTGSGTVKTSLLYEKEPGVLEHKKTEYLLCEKCAKELEEWLEKTEITIKTPPLSFLELESFRKESHKKIRRE